ncbi:MAG TPA: hypothetical protein PLO62_03150 [Candidatus Hydrogenedentes bacterium]|nr:hypothetical protein [Candidatus Hydrogenedentota bacterium]HOS04174.1 hypothetical protein [Candidatus Hydrogenedentota bacterium]
MKRAWNICLTILLAAPLGACSQPGEKTEILAPPSSTSAPEASSSSAGAEPSTQGADASGASLVGKTWQLDKFTLSFTSEKDMIVRGGPVDSIAPNGLTASYSVDKGIFKAVALGKTYTGTWDGTNLVVDGQVGIRK